MRVVQMNPSSAPKGNPSPYPPVMPTGTKKTAFDISRFKKDDWILIGIIAILILEGSDDYILLCALGYLFLVGL